MATDFSAAIFFVCVYSPIRLIGIYHFLFQRQPNSSPPLGYKVKTLFSSIIAMVLKLTEKDIREFFVQALNLEPKLLISYLVKEVRLFDDKVEIQFNSPINKSPDDSQGFLFYTGFRKMPYTIINKPQPKLKSVKVEIYI